MTKVKICGITNLEDALLSVQYGADMLGFNFYPKSPRYLTPEDAGKIIDELPDAVEKVGVFVNESVERIVSTATTARLTIIQLHGDETPELIGRLKSATRIPILKALRISSDFEPQALDDYKSVAILLDAHSALDYGGTGATFDWKIAKMAVDSNASVFLAGGLSNDNIVNALQEVEPYAVDACSSLEMVKGRKDRVKLINFLTRVQDFDWMKRMSSRKLSSLSDYFRAVRLRPAMYLGEHSITKLSDQLVGFQMAIEISGQEFDWGFLTGFDDFVHHRLHDSRSAFSWGKVILDHKDGGEKDALEMFFALLQEFKQTQHYA